MISLMSKQNDKSFKVAHEYIKDGIVVQDVQANALRYYATTDNGRL